jgi:hypothetical protein
MNSQKILRSIQAATLVFSVPLFAAPNFLRFVATSSNIVIADGGAPVPPYPKPPVASNTNIVIADGGAPVPPYPPTATKSKLA